MHPRLEEIRKRLLTPSGPTVSPRHKMSGRSGAVFSSKSSLSQEPINLDSDAEKQVEESPAKQKSLESHLIIERDSSGGSAATEVDVPISHGMPKPVDGLAQAVAELFEPARQCQRRLVEIAEASEAISHLTLLALDLCEPLKSFHDHIKKLSSLFESMRTFRDELGVLAESFAPVRALHRQIIQLAQTVRTHLGEVASGLQPANTLKIDIADLAEAINSVSELQVQFYELSEAFGNAVAPSGTAETVSVPVEGKPEVK